MSKPVHEPVNARAQNFWQMLRAKLVGVPPRWWIGLLVVSVLLHIVAAGFVLLLLFGGEPSGGDAQASAVVSVGEAGFEEFDLAVEPPAPSELIAEPLDEPDLSALLELPLDAHFNDMLMDSNVAAIAPAMPLPVAAPTQHSLSAGGLISGVPQSFADYIRHLQKTGIDVVFVIDATGSMVWVHQAVQMQMQKLAAYVRNLVPLARFAIIVYRDYDDPEFVTRASPLSFDVLRARDFLRNIDASGGGDVPEAMMAGLRAAVRDSAWRAGAQRVIIVIGDAPPHPRELTQARQLATNFKKYGGRLSALDSRVEANRHLLRRNPAGGTAPADLKKQGVLSSYRQLARLGGGTAVTLQAEQQLMKVLALLIFDDRFHDELAPFLANLE